MGDDIGWMQPSIYHRGLMVGETPNIDRIGNEGAIFMDYVAMQSCTSGRNAFFTGMYPLRTGMIPPQLPGSPSYLRPGTPALAKFLLDLGYNTGEFGKNHLGDHTASLPTAHGFQEYWGYLYHLDAMQQVSFPDINSAPTVQGVAPPCRNTPVPGLPEVPGAVDQKTTLCLMPPRPVIWCKSPDGTESNQQCSDEGPLTLERSKTVDEEISAKVVDFIDRNDPKKTNKPFFVWYNPARMHVVTVLSPKYEDRLVMLSPETLGLLREWWKARRAGPPASARHQRASGQEARRAPMDHTRRHCQHRHGTNAAVKIGRTTACPAGSSHIRSKYPGYGA
jgi:arylsulfatase A-like enzyme